MKRTALIAACALFATAASAELGVELTSRREEVSQTRAEKELLAAQLDGLPERETALSQELSRQVRTLYRLQRGGMLPLVSGVDAMIQHASRVAHHERLTSKTLAELGRVREERSKLGQDALALEAKLAAVEQQLRDMEQQQLAQEAAERTRAVALAMPAPAPQPSYGLTLVGAEPGLPSERFTDLVGGLALPVAGSAAISDAARPGDDGAGLAFESKGGASVRAAAAGRVAFAERQSQYGLLVIVEHDHRYRTVYGGLGSIEVQVGDSVSKSARLGAAGETPVYFEVRRDQKSQDARRWLGL